MRTRSPRRLTTISGGATPRPSDERNLGKEQHAEPEEIALVGGRHVEARSAQRLGGPTIRSSLPVSQCTTLTRNSPIEEGAEVAVRDPVRVPHDDQARLAARRAGRCAVASSAIFATAVAAARRGPRRRRRPFPTRPVASISFQRLLTPCRLARSRQWLRHDAGQPALDLDRDRARLGEADALLEPLVIGCGGNSSMIGSRPRRAPRNAISSRSTIIVSSTAKL